MSEVRKLAFVRKGGDGLYYVWSHRDGTFGSEPSWTFAYKSKRKADVEAARLRRVLGATESVVWGSGTEDPFAALSRPKRGEAILTDERGRPMDRPKRSDFSSDVDFIHAVHAFNDRVTGIGNRAFDEGFRSAMARPPLPPGTKRG
jgi:hypothetical protein